MKKWNDPVQHTIGLIVMADVDGYVEFHVFSFMFLKHSRGSTPLIVVFVEAVPNAGGHTGPPLPVGVDLCVDPDLLVCYCLFSTFWTGTVRTLAGKMPALQTANSSPCGAGRG